jgi:hypothetical protein
VQRSMRYKRSRVEGRLSWFAALPGIGMSLTGPMPAFLIQAKPHKTGVERGLEVRLAEKAWLYMDGGVGCGKALSGKGREDRDEYVRVGSVGSVAEVQRVVCVAVVRNRMDG